MVKEKTLTIELSHENPLGDGYFYAMLDLPAEEHEIRDPRADPQGLERGFIISTRRNGGRNMYPNYVTKGGGSS